MGSAGRTGRGLSAIGLLVLAALLAVGALPAADAIGVHGPDVHAVLTAAQRDGRVAFTLALHNEGGLPAVDVRMEAPFPDGLRLESTGADVWRAALTDLAVGGDAQVDFLAIIDGDVDDPSVMGVGATITYRAPGGSQDYFETARSEVTVTAENALSPFLWVAAVVAGLLLAAGYARKLRSEAVRIDQLFLLHDSGMLIRHYTNGSGLQRDSDILSGMLIVLQEFVRDSFRDRRSLLEEVRFGDRRVLMVRGRHAVMAALLTGKRLNGLPARLERAVAEFERAHGAELADWNGDLGSLSAADDAFRDLLLPRYTASAPA